MSIYPGRKQINVGLIGNRDLLPELIGGDSSNKKNTTTVVNPALSAVCSLIRILEIRNAVGVDKLFSDAILFASPIKYR